MQENWLVSRRRKGMVVEQRHLDGACEERAGGAPWDLRGAMSYRKIFWRGMALQSDVSLCHFPARWPWACHSTSLSLHLPIGKIAHRV